MTIRMSGCAATRERSGSASIVSSYLGCNGIASDFEHSTCKRDVRQNRWFSASDVTVTEAKFLDVILYSAEQVFSDYLHESWHMF